MRQRCRCSNGVPCCLSRPPASSHGYQRLASHAADTVATCTSETLKDRPWTTFAGKTPAAPERRAWSATRSRCSSDGVRVEVPHLELPPTRLVSLGTDVVRAACGRQRCRGRYFVRSPLWVTEPAPSPETPRHATVTERHSVSANYVTVRTTTPLAVSSPATVAGCRWCSASRDLGEEGFDFRRPAAGGRADLLRSFRRADHVRTAPVTR